MVNIEGLNVVDVLIALWNHSHEQGMSSLGRYANSLSKENARKELEYNNGKVDYVNGRVIKCNLPFGAKEFDEWLYDRDNGPGAAQKAIDELRR